MVQESAQDVASLLASATRMPRGQAALSWAEFLPRYLLIEDRLKDRRVLEIGTCDVRSLAKLQEAGASRVVGTAVNPSIFERTRFRSPSVELLAMDSGRIDFGDNAFDVILVVDLGAQLAHNPRFLEEVKRVLSPEGFCMLAFPGPGRDLAHLLDPEPGLSSLDTNHLEAAVRQAFPQARLLLQAPFVGVAIHPEGRPPAEVDVALEPALAGGIGRPSLVLALCGRGAPVVSDRTLVELPFTDFEAMTDAAQARVSSDIRRLLQALEEAKATVADRDRSLREVQERLPKLRAALQSKLRVVPLGDSQVVSPTVLERPEPTDTGPQDTVFVPEPVPTVVEQTEAYLQLQTQVQALEASGATHIHALSEARVLQDEMQIALTESEAQLQAIRQQGTQDEALKDGQRRIAQLEHTLGNYEQQNQGLREELEAELEVRYALGTDHRDAETRMNHVRAQLEQQVLLRTQAEVRLQDREVFLAAALSEADLDRDRLTARVLELEADETQQRERFRLTLAASEHAQRAGAESLAQTDALHIELDTARAEAQRFARDNEDLRLTLRAQEAVLSQATAKDADRRAVEMAAAHLSREVESLRGRVQDLRNERDTLAATSQMLLEERDTARALARRAVATERSAATLSQTLGEAEQIIEGHEVEARAAQDRIENLHRAVAELREDNQGLKGELQQGHRTTQSMQAQCSEAISRVQRLDQNLAEMQAELRDAVARRAEIQRERDDLEEMLRDVSFTARSAVRDVAHGEQVQAELRGQISGLIDERADVEAARGRAEAEYAAAVGGLTQERSARAEAVTMLAKVQGDRAALKARLELTSDRIEALSGQLANALESDSEVVQEAADPEVAQEMERLRKAKSDADIGLGRTLEEAAKLSDRLAQMQRDLHEATQRLEKGEVDRLGVERQRRSAAEAVKSAEAARVQGLAEIQVLREQVKRLEFERADLIRDCDARAMRAQQQQRRITDLQKDCGAFEAQVHAQAVGQQQAQQQLVDENQALREAASQAQQQERAETDAVRAAAEDRAEFLAGKIAEMTHERGGFVAAIHELQERLEVVPRGERIGEGQDSRVADEPADSDWVVAGLRAQIADLRGGQAVLRSVLIDKDEDLAGLRACNEELRTRTENTQTIAVVAQSLEPEMVGLLAERILSTELMVEGARDEARDFKARLEVAMAALEDARADVLHLGLRCEELELVVDGLRGARSAIEGQAVEVNSRWRRAEEAQALQQMLRQGLEAEQDGLRSVNAELREQVAGLQTRSQQAEWYLGEWEAELAAVRVELSSATQALRGAQVQVTDVRDALQTAQQQTKQEAERSADAHSQIQRAELGIIELTDKLGALEAAAVDAECRAQTTDDELQAVQQELDALAEQAEQTQADLEGRVREVEAAKSLEAQGHRNAELKLEFAQEGLRGLKEEAADAIAVSAELGRSLERQRVEHEAARAEAQADAERSAERQADLTSQVDKLQAAQAEAEAAAGVAKVLEETLKTEITELEALLGEASDEASGLAVQVKTLQAQIDVQRSEAKTATQELEAHQGRAEQAAVVQAQDETTIADLEVRLDATESELETSNALAATLEAKVSALDRVRTEAEESAEQLARTAAQLKSQLDSAESEAKSDAAQASELLAMLEEEAAESKSLCEGLQTRVSELEIEGMQSQELVQQAEMLQAGLRAQLASLASKNTDSETRAEALVAEVSALTEAQAEANRANQDLVRSNDTLQDELQTAHKAQAEGALALSEVEGTLENQVATLAASRDEAAEVLAQSQSIAAAALAKSELALAESESALAEVKASAESAHADSEAALMRSQEDFESALVEAKTALVEAKTALAEANSSAESARGESEAASRSQRESESALAAAKAALAEAESARREAESALIEAEAARDEAKGVEKAGREEFEAALKQSQNESRSAFAEAEVEAKAALAESESALAEAESARSAAVAALDHSEQESAAAISALEAARRDATATQAQSQAALEAASRAHEELQSNSKEMERAAEEAEQARVALQAKLENLTDQKASAEDELQEALRMGASLKELQANFDEERKADADAKASVEASLFESQERLQRLEAAQLELQAAYEAGQEQCGSLKTELDSAVAAQAKAEDMLADLQVSSIEVEVEHQGTRDRLSAALEQVSAVQETLREAQVRSAKLEAAGKQLLGERTRLVDELAKAQVLAIPETPDAEALSRALARAGDAEMRAERAEAKTERSMSEADAATLSTAQAGERLKAAEARADRADQSLRKESQRAKDAEGRAVHAEAAVEACNGRVQDLENRRRGLETRVQDADNKSQHSGRRVEELSGELRQLEARLRSGGSSLPGSDADLRSQRRNLEDTVAERDLEVERLSALSERATQDLDEARADTGRRLNELKVARQAVEQVQGELAAAQAESQALKARLQASGDSAELKAQLALHAEEIARLKANHTSLQGERSRLHTLIQDSEQRQVQGERRVAELEAALSERTHRIEMLTREIQEKNERLRRLSGLE